MTDTNNMTDTNKKSPPPRTTVRIPTPSGVRYSRPGSTCPRDRARFPRW